MFRYVTRATVEEKTLIKAGVVIPLPILRGPHTTYGYGLGVGVEQKVSPTFSVQGLVVGQYLRTGAIINTKVLELPVSGRYYYSMKRRMRNRLSANSFSNNYLGLQLENILYGNGQFYSSTTSGNQTVILLERMINRRFDMLNAASIQWGIQRRLGLYGYLDANVSFAIHPVLTQYRASEFIMPMRVNLNLGLGW